MDRSLFTQQGPMTTPNTEHGREPTLREIIIHYYYSHGITRSKAIELAEDYIAAWLKEANK